MKKILIVGLVVGIFCGYGNYIERNYTRKDCKIIQVVDGWATIEDKCGNIWDVKNENFKIGEIVNLKMHDNNTIGNIQDDIVKKVEKR